MTERFKDIAVVGLLKQESDLRRLADEIGKPEKAAIASTEAKRREALRVARSPKPR